MFKLNNVLSIKQSIFGIIIVFLLNILLNFIMVIYGIIFRPNCISDYSLEDCKDFLILVDKYRETVPFFNFLFLIAIIYFICCMLIRIFKKSKN